MQCKCNKRDTCHLCTPSLSPLVSSQLTGPYITYLYTALVTVTRQGRAGFSTGPACNSEGGRVGHGNEAEYAKDDVR